MITHCSSVQSYGAEALKITEAQGHGKAVECKPQNAESSQVAAGGDGDPQQESSTCSTALGKGKRQVGQPKGHAGSTSRSPTSCSRKRSPAVHHLLRNYQNLRQAGNAKLCLCCYYPKHIAAPKGGMSWRHWRMTCLLCKSSFPAAPGVALSSLTQHGKDESNSEKKRRTSPLLKKAEERCPVIRR